MVIRNVIVLLILHLEDEDVAVDAILHFWYSTHLREEHINLIESLILPFIVNMTSTPLARGHAIFDRSFRLGNGSVQIAIMKEHWLSIVDILTAQRDRRTAQQSYDSIMIPESDNYDLRLYQISRDLHRRASLLHMRKTGILLPFGASVQGFNSLNL